MYMERIQVYDGDEKDNANLYRNGLKKDRDFQAKGSRSSPDYCKEMITDPRPIEISIAIVMIF